MIGSRIHSLLYPDADDISSISILIVGVGGIGC